MLLDCKPKQKKGILNHPTLLRSREQINFEPYYEEILNRTIQLPFFASIVVWLRLFSRLLFCSCILQSILIESQLESYESEFDC